MVGSAILAITPSSTDMARAISITNIARSRCRGGSPSPACLGFMSSLKRREPLNSMPCRAPHGKPAEGTCCDWIRRGHRWRAFRNQGDHLAREWCGLHRNGHWLVALVGRRDVGGPCGSLPTAPGTQPGTPARKAGVLVTHEDKVPRETDSPLEGSGFEPSVPRKLPTTGIARQSSRGSITSRSGNPTTNPSALVDILDQDRRTGCPADRLPTARAADRSGTASRNRGRESRPAGPC